MGIHENIGPAPMPTPLGPYNPYYKQKPFTSTTFKYEDYVEKKYNPEPTLPGLPEYVSNKYDLKHNPQIPYRDIKPDGYDKLQPYQHVFPKYTTTYHYYPTTTESYTEAYKEPETYKPESYTTPEPYKPDDPYKADPVKEDEASGESNQSNNSQE